MTGRYSFVSILLIALTALAACPHPTPESATPFRDLDKPPVKPDKATIYIFNDGPVEESPSVWVENWWYESKAHDDYRLDYVGHVLSEGFTWFYVEPGTRTFWLQWGDERSPRVSHGFDVLPGQEYYFRVRNHHQGVHGRVSMMLPVEPVGAVAALHKCCRHVPARQSSY